MKKINRQKAKRLFDDGVKITLCPSKLMYGAPWYPECEIDKNRCPDNSFQSIVNNFTVYNCTYETGYYPHYYISD